MQGGGDKKGELSSSSPFFMEKIGLYDSLLDHRLGDFHKACDVRALHVVEVAVLFGAVLHAGVVDRRHDLVQLGVDLLGRPVVFHRVLAHLQSRRGDAAGVDSLGRSNDLDVLLELCDRIMVLCHGKITGICDAKKVTKEQVGMMMTGSTMEEVLGIG